MRLAIDIGHNCNYDHGAAGIRSEDSLNYEVGTKLIKKCEDAGIKVIDCAPVNPKSLSDSLNQRVKAANNSNADFFISIHQNSFPGAKGSEILCIPGGDAERVANIILPEIVKLGFQNRGVKARYDLFVLNETNMPAILIECAFCDSPSDMAIYDSNKMAQAIFEGILKAFDMVIYHVVQKGETLYSIARIYNTTFKNLIALNNLEDPNLIHPGQKIRVK